MNGLTDLNGNHEQLDAVCRMAKVGGWEIILEKMSLVWTDEVYRIHEVDADFVPTLEKAIGFYAPNCRQTILAAVTQAVEQGKSFDCVLEIITAKQNSKWVHALGNAIYQDQKVVGVLGTFQDITEQHLAEKKLQDSERIKQAILDGISANIAFVNEQQELIWANRNASITAKRPLADMIGKTCYSLWANPQGPCKNCPTLRAMHSHKGEEGVRVDVDGKTWKERSEPVFDAEGHLLGVVEIVQDITKQLELESRIQQSEKMESIGLLAGGIAHDFNNILFAILGYTEIANRSLAPNAPVAQHLQHIHKAAERATQLVKKILRFSRFEQQEMRVVSLSEEIQEALSLLRATLPSSVLFDIQCGTFSGNIFADPISIQEILINVFTNACHAMNDQGTLSVRLQEIHSEVLIEGNIAPCPAGYYAVLDIRDTGVGMNARTLEKIYDPFFTTKPVDKGTGLGLSVVFGLMQMHGGNIQICSEVGVGTTIRLYFPSAQTKSAAAVVPDNAPQGKGECILFVDDEPEIVAMATRGLTLYGYKVISATDGEQAMSLLREQAPQLDLLITDQTMPYMTGMELAKAVHAEQPTLPIIIITGYSRQLHEALTAIPGVQKICYKPMNLQELACAVHECLHKELA